MESKLIIIRGNSGSGKTTTSKTLQNYGYPDYRVENLF